MRIRPSKRAAATIFAVWLLPAGAAFAQTAQDQPTSNGVAQQFKSGANRVGDGASKIGHGIEQGAILTWHAIRDGAETVGSHFDGHPAPSDRNSAAAPQQSR